MSVLLYSNFLGFSEIISSLWCHTVTADSVQETKKMELEFAVNGERFNINSVDPSTTLLEFLRSNTPFKSVKLGCGEGNLSLSHSLSSLFLFFCFLGKIYCSFHRKVVPLCPESIYMCRWSLVLMLFPFIRVSEIEELV